MTLDDAGNLGINDTSPENRLTVNGSSRFKDTMFFATTNRGLISWGTMGGGTGFGVQAASGNALSLGANATWDHIVITTAGNVGIGRDTAHGKLDIRAADLGTSSGDVSVVSRSSCSMGNTMYLLEEYVRTSAGSDWTTAGVRLQAKTDSTYQGYIQFNGDSNNYGLSFGAGAGGTSSPGTTAERMRIQSDGNVGIGTASPAADLEVSTASGGELVVDNYGASGVMLQQRNGGATNSGSLKLSGGTLINFFTNDTEKVRINSDGNVGIRATAPVNQLHVGDGTDNNTWIGVQATAGYYSGIKLSRGAGDWSSTANNNFGVIVTDAGIAISKFTDPGSNVTGRGDYLTVINGGSVGIGTVSPPHKLSIYGTGAGKATVQIEGEGGADPYINFLVNNTTHWAVGADDSASDSFKISQHSALGTNDRITVLSGGSVGIGTNSPSNRLHIEGTTLSNASIRIEKTTTGVNEDPGLVLAAANDTNGYRIGSIFFQGGTTSYAQIRAEMAGTGTGAKIYFVAGSQTNPVSNSSTKTLEIEDGIITAATAIRPLTDSSYTLGQNTLRWSHLYVDAITCGGAISGTGASITSLNGSNISSGTVAAARLGSGSSITTKFLRGDNTWQTVSGGSGTVTSVATSGAITGGTITTSGTISHSTANGYKHIPADGADLKFLAYASAGTAEWAGGLLNYSDYALFAQRYDDGSSGGALSGGQWNTRVLNATVVNNYTTASAWASLGSNQITMQAGTYYARVWAVAYDIDEQQINLANVNNSNQLMLSAPMSARGNSTLNSAVTMSEGTFAITTNGHKLVAYHWANLAETNTYGGGRPLEGGSTSPVAGIDYDYDTYVSVQIWRVA